MIKNHEVALVDPTTILALKCIELAQENTAKPSQPDGLSTEKNTL
jgi:aspartate racemase